MTRQRESFPSFKSNRAETFSEVRRAALYNLPRTSSTIDDILNRTRDVDPILRRTVYHGSLSATALPDARLLSIAQREAVVQNGLKDREGSVRKATAAMLGGWVDQCGGDLVEVCLLAVDDAQRIVPEPLRRGFEPSCRGRLEIGIRHPS